MQNDNTAQPYSHQLLDDYTYSFGFVTNQGVEYRISFRPTDYLFAGIPEVAKQTFEFIILPVSVPEGVKPKLDTRVSLTVAEILKDFFSHLPDNVTIYICDSSDGREKIRQRLFDSWFSLFQGNETFIKVDVALDTLQPNTIDFTIILLRNNPFLKQILASIEQLKKDFERNK